MDLHELSPVGRRATGGREGRWFEWFAEVCQDLPDRPRIGDECDQPDVAAAGGARKWKLLTHPGHQLGPIAALAPAGHAAASFGVMQVGTKLAGFVASLAFGGVQLVAHEPRAGLVVLLGPLIAGARFFLGRAVRG